MSVSTWTVTGSKSRRTQFTAKGTRVGLSHQLLLKGRSDADDCRVPEPQEGSLGKALGRIEQQCRLRGGLLCDLSSVTRLPPVFIFSFVK